MPPRRGSDEITERLASKLSEACTGQDLGDVIGASFTLLEGALQHVPDPRWLLSAAATLRDIADELERLATARRQ